MVGHLKVFVEPVGGLDVPEPLDAGGLVGAEGTVEDGGHLGTGDGILGTEAAVVVADEQTVLHGGLDS